MPSQKYRLSKGALHFGPNRPSTDALNAVNSWSDSESGRVVRILRDSDQELEVELHWNDSDRNAGSELDREIDERAIERSIKADG